MGQRTKATTATNSPPPLYTAIELLTPASPQPPPYSNNNNNNNTNNDAAPLLPPSGPSPSADDIPPDVARDQARIDAIVSHAASLAAKRVVRQLLVCAVLLIPETVAVGLVASALRDWKRVKALPDEARTPVSVVMVSIIVEVMWIGLWLPLVLRCCLARRHRILAVTVGFLGVAAAGVSVYMLAVLGQYLANGTCDADKYRDACHRGLTKGVAAGCVRVLVTAPLCIGLAVVGFKARRKHPPPKGPWMRFVYGVGALVLPAPP